MKKLLLTIFIFSFIFHPQIHAQESTPVPTAEATPSSSLTLTVNYELPYPGLLPGSPFYFIKMIRDSINDLLISDPVRKSNFYLLQADKRLAAAIMLFEKGNEELGEETLSKSLNYLDKSISKMEEAKKEQDNVMDVFGKIKASSENQKEEIGMLRDNAKGEMENKLMINYNRAVEIQNRVNAFSP